MENEMMVNEATEVIEEVVATNKTKSGIGFGTGTLIGASAVGVGYALYTVGRKVFAHIKSKKGVEIEAAESFATEVFVEPADEK